MSWDLQVCWTCKLNLRRFEDLDNNDFVAKTSTLQRLRQFVKRSLHEQRKRVISWPISVIVKARSQLEHATKDKLEGDGDNVLRWKGSDFSNLWALWLDYSKVCATLRQERSLHRQFRRHNIQILGYNQSQSTRKYIWENVLGTFSLSHLKIPKNGLARGRLILKITDLSVTALKWL